ncbi:hypothetical protein D3C85_1636220 [compost metagenome]
MCQRFELGGLQLQYATAYIDDPDAEDNIAIAVHTVEGAAASAHQGDGSAVGGTQIG